jgi:RsiW-degrading membrane proteinase PrsW (M82 family)
MFYLLFLITLAILPSIIWLLFYLRKDAHPESNPMILKVFFWGMLFTFPTLFTQLGFFELSLPLLINIFIGVALVEEFFKYLVVRLKVINSSELDEPLDIMLYMIISALGFAAVENIFKLLKSFLSLKAEFLEIIRTTAFIFITSTFLHALASAILGYFLALSFFETKKRSFFFTTGLFLATFLHGLYNFAIMEIKENQNIIFSFLVLLILAGSALFVSFGFKRLKKMKSISKIR